MKILAVGMNYAKHNKELDGTLYKPEEPVIFTKPDSALLKDGKPFFIPDFTKQCDYEAELVVVMGREARHVSEAEAMDYVYGYTCGNDVSTRDLQFARGNQWVLSKSLEGFGPIGPCLVTGDALDGSHLDISCAVNGEVRQNSNTSDLIFSIPYLVSYLSHVMTLLPGDIISTGTPGGISGMKKGDIVEIEIEGLGVLRNRIA